MKQIDQIQLGQVVQVLVVHLQADEQRRSFATKQTRTRLWQAPTHVLCLSKGFRLVFEEELSNICPTKRGVGQVTGKL